MKHFFTTFLVMAGLCGVLHNASAQVFSEDFESGATGWVEFDNGIGLTENWVLTNPGFNSTWSAYLQYEPIGGSSSQDWLVTPLITPTAGNATLSFFQKQSYATDWGSVYTIRVSTSSQSTIATFTTIFTQTETNFSTDYTIQTVDLSAYIGTPIYIAFVMTQDDGDDWFIDDVTVGPYPCETPDNITVYGNTTTTTNFSWTEYNGATQWDIAVVDENTPPVGGINSTFNPVMITGLVPGTAYDFYVRSICGAGDTSVWAGPVSFQTNCLATFTAPYSQPFNGDNIPPCWTQSGSETWNFSTNAGYAAAAAGDHTGNGGNYAWIDGSAPSGAAQISTLTSPRVNISTLIHPALYYRIFSHNTDGSEYNTLLVELFNGTTWQTIQTTQADLGAGWKEFIINLHNYTITGPIQVRFTVTENAASGSFYNDILIDDVEIKEGPTCYDVTNLSASGITTTTANLNWTAGDVGSNQWAVEIVPAGSTPSGIGVITNSHPYTATGLTMATDYEFYVREICAVGDSSEWVGPLFFTTLCGVYTAPYLQTFDGTTIPRCWAQSGANTWTFSTGADYGALAAGDHTGNTGRYAWMDGSNNDNGETSTLTSPQVDITTLSNPALRYWLFSNNIDNATLNTLTVEFFDGAAWNTVQTVSGNLGNGWFEVIINLNSFVITGPVQARFTVTGSAGFGTWYHDILVDDVEFYEGPLCATPAALNASGITTAAANLSWTTGIGSAWELELVNANDPLTGNGIVVSTPPYAQTGLLPGTPYQFAVREICGAGDTSAWSAPFIFTTACPAPLPGGSFADAILINTLTYTDSRNTAYCYTNTAAGASPDVWYRVDADICTNNINVSLCNSSYDTYLYIYESDGTTMLNLNDDACNGTRSQLSQTVTGGTTVYILVEGFALEKGEYILDVEQTSDISADFSYSAAQYCTDATNPIPTINGTSGGTFSSTAGLVLNIATGEINLAASTAGNYIVTYTVTVGACTQQETAAVVITNSTDASFSYLSNTYCQNAMDALPTISGTAGGAFSSGAGLSINTTTGAVQFAASTAGSYTITYTTAGLCSESSTFNMDVLAVPAANHSLSTQDIEACISTGLITATLSILGDDYEGYYITRQWFDIGGTPQGTVQAGTYTDPDNNPTTPYLHTKDTTVTASGYFQFTVGVIRCGVVGAVQTINTYIYAPIPSTLAMSAGQANCYSTNRNIWVDFYDDVNGSPIVSLLDYTGAGDADALANTIVQLDFDASVTNCDGGTEGIRPRLQRYWQITPANNMPAQVRLYFDRSELDALGAQTTLGAGGLVITDLTLWKFRDGHLCTETPTVVPFTEVNMTDMSLGYPNDKAFSDISTVFAIEFEVTSFSHFVLVPNTSVLALDFLSFGAQATEQGTVLLDWELTQQHQYATFELMRSPDAIHFERIATIEGSPQQTVYHYTDAQPLSGTSYYYIHAIRYDGIAENTDKQAVHFETATALEIFPNPARIDENLYIRSVQTNKGQAWAQIVDQWGRVLQSKRFALAAGVQTHALPLHLPQGVYVLRWTTQDGVVSSRPFVIGE